MMQSAATRDLPVAFANTAMSLWMVLLLTLVSAQDLCGDFVCQHGSICRDGPVDDFGDHSPIEKSFLNLHKQRSKETQKHCECDPLHTGIDCSIPFETCGDDFSHKCYFGGECYLGLENILGEDDLFCDCSLARDSEGKRFVGKYCEHLLTSNAVGAVTSRIDPSMPSRAGTVYCRSSGTFDDHICMNNAECNPLYPSESTQPCLCKDGYTGPSCEFQDTESAVCSLPCQNGGTCTLGRPDPDTQKMAYDFFRRSDINVEFQWCDCLDGFYGDLCEVSTVPCGDKVCFNGASCVDWSDTDGTVAHTCSCEHSEGASFAGKYCQYEATTYCPESDNFEGDFFCANGGHCREEPWLGCDCPPGYSGFNCGYYAGSGEFFAEELQQASCDLDCNGKGTCVFGIKNLDYLGAAVNAEHLSQASSKTFQHCSCQNGYTGLQCEHEVDQCGGHENHFCLHGALCTTREDGKHLCDCSTATSEIASAFAGDHCEHPATSICSNLSAGSFCVNDGTCIDSSEEGDSGDICSCPDGWKGRHCELKVQLEGVVVAEPNKELKFVARFFIVLTVALLVVVIFTVVKMKVENQRMEQYRFLSTRPASVVTKWPSRHADHVADVNLSPHKDQGADGDDEYTIAFRPQRPPTTVDFAVAASMIPLPIPVDDVEADAPQLYMGPPRDEDGNELADVSFD